MPSLFRFLILLFAPIISTHAFQICVSSATDTSVMPRSPILRQTKFMLLAAPDSEEAEVNEVLISTITGETTARKVMVRCPDCDLCDGSGRILGGIGTVLEWWPIKAYRPCPNLIERGGRYEKAGQGLDEIAFGRDSTFQAGE